ncbi:MAG TPA: FtsX-like permease family protein, partial [Vicinamibacterales bacterium]
MTFILLMAAREIRASWRRLVFFFVCVAIGVAAIVALRSMIQNIRTGLSREARALIAGDVVIGTNRPWSPDVRAAIDRRLADEPIVARQEAVEVATMVRPEEGRGAAVARMVELRGVQPGFPFYGVIGLETGESFSHALLAGHGALVRPELLAQLELRVGDRLVIGGIPFTIRGVISQEPGRRVGAFSFGSRVLVDYDDLMHTGLLSFGSRAGYQILLKMTGDPQALVRDLRARFRDQFVSVRSYRSTEDQIGDDLLRAENYLSLVGFVILVLGGIGVWSVTRVFVRQKIKSVAILKCVGATTRQVLAAYVLQVVLLGLSGSVLGVILARIGIASIPEKIGAALGGSNYGLTASAVWQGVSVGLLVSLLFSLVPLLEVRRVKPLLLLRGTISDPERLGQAPWWTIAGARARFARLDWLQIGAATAVTAALVAIASWQAASLRVGLIVCAGFGAVALVLNIAGAAIVYAVRPVSRVRFFPLRHAVLSFGRPGNQTRVILLAVGLGSFFVIGVRALQANLLQQFSLELSAG